MTRIYLTEDHPILLHLIKSLIAAQKDMQLVGESGDGLVAQKQVADLKPDLLVADIRLESLDGIELIKRCRETNPNLVCVVMTALQDDGYIQEAFNAGAGAFINKMHIAQHLLPAIRSALNGKRYNSMDFPDGTAPASTVLRRNPKNMAFLPVIHIPAQERQDHFAAIAGAFREDVNIKHTSKQDSLACVCAWCCRLREDSGRWVEVHISQLKKYKGLSHGICPDCARVALPKKSS